MTIFTKTVAPSLVALAFAAGLAGFAQAQGAMSADPMAPAAPMASDSMSADPMAADAMKADCMAKAEMETDAMKKDEAMKACETPAMGADAMAAPDAMKPAQ